MASMKSIFRFLVIVPIAAIIARALTSFSIVTSFEESMATCEEVSQGRRQGELTAALGLTKDTPMISSDRRGRGCYGMLFVGRRCLEYMGYRCP
jgi:hypothetical protein